MPLFLFYYRYRHRKESGSMYEIMLDVQKGGFQAVLEGFRVGDANARELCVRLCDGRRPYRLPVKSGGEGKIVPDYIATLYIRGRSAVHYSSCRSYTDRIEHVFLSEEIEAGVSECEIRIIGGGKVLTSAKFKIVATDVLQDDSAIEAENTFSALNEALERVLGAEGSAEAAKSAAEAAKSSAEAAATDSANAVNEVSEMRSALEEKANKSYVASYVTHKIKDKADKADLEAKADKTELGDKVSAAKKTSEMTAEVGIDENGRLWFDPRAWEELAITLFSVTPSGFVEKGATVDNITVSWKANKKDVTAVLYLSGVEKGRYTPEDGGNDKTVTLENLNIAYNPSAASPTVSLTVYNSSTAIGKVQRSQTVKYANRIYMGTAEIPAYIDSVFIRSLEKSKLSAARSMTETVTAGEGEYIWYACPAAGYGTPSFKLGNPFEGGAEKAGEIMLTNASGYSEVYQVWRSVNSGLGTMKVEVI